MSHIVKKVWTDEDAVHVSTRDGLEACYPFSMWKRFAAATPEQRADFYLSYSGIHWPQIDEDLSFEGMFARAGLCERTATEDSICYLPSYEAEGDEEHWRVAEE